jgi:drug/metabolite transporter (DMT)-like permease
MWVITFSLFLLFATANTLWNRHLAQRSRIPLTLPPALSFLVALLPIGVVASRFLGEYWISLESKTLFLLIATGTLIGLYNWLSFVGNKTVNVASSQVISQLYIITAALAGWLILGEPLSQNQLIGGALLFISAVTASVASGSRKQNINKGILYFFAAAAALGLGLVAEKATLDNMSFSAYLVVGFASQTIALLIIARKDLSYIPRLKRNQWAGIALKGSLTAIAGLMYLLTLQSLANVSVTVLLTTAQVPIAVLASYYILREKKNLKAAYIACGIATIGLVIFSL